MRQMTMRRLHSRVLRAETLSPLRNINFRKISRLRFTERGLFKPLLDLSALTNDNRIQLGLLFFPLRYQIAVKPQCLRRMNGILQMLPDKLLIIGRPIDNRPVFRGIRGGGYVALLILTPVESLVPEISDLFHRGI